MGSAFQTFQRVVTIHVTTSNENFKNQNLVQEVYWTKVTQNTELTFSTYSAKLVEVRCQLT